MAPSDSLGRIPRVSAVGDGTSLGVCSVVKFVNLGGR